MTELEECQRSLGKLYMVQWIVNRMTQFLTLHPETLNRTPVELRNFLADMMNAAVKEANGTRSVESLQISA